MIDNMTLNQQSGFVNHANILASPHFDQRPANCQIELLVIHNISLPPAKFGQTYIDQLFLGKLNPNAHPEFKNLSGLKVSTHILINRQGKLTQYVSFFDRAWHAGQSSWQGRQQCNDFSIGIELEGTDTLAYTDRQYQQLTALTKLLMQHFPIKLGNIVGHCDIAPQRKTDPGPAFDWNHFKKSL